MDMDALLQPEEERKFKCDECGRAYRHAGSLSNHKKTHEVGSFQCNICGKENSNALALKNHLRSHTSQKKYPCLECGKTFYRPSQLVTHERVHESRQPKEQPPMEVDMGFVTHEDQNGHTDCFLSSGISTLNSLSENITDVACNTQTESSDFVDEPFKSDLSDNSYTDQGSLSHHTKTHQTEMFECSVCFKLFNDMDALFNHQKSHKSKGPVDSLCGPYTLASSDQFSPQNQDVPVNFCHLCQILFSSEEEFQDHIQMHNSSLLLNQNESTFYETATCFSESPFYHPPVKHDSPASSQSHSGSFDLPNEQMTNDNGLFYHCSDVESSPLNSIQMQPSTSVTNHATVVSSAVGSEERPFKCDICFKTYRHYGSLVNHKRSHQVGDYQCSICGKSCPHLASFKSHLRTHKEASSHCRRQLQTMEDQQETSEDGTDVGIEPRDESLLNGYLNEDCGQTSNYGVTKLEKYDQQPCSISCNSNNNDEHLQDSAENQGNHIHFDGINGNDIEENNFPERVSIDDDSYAADEQDEDDRDFYQCSFCGNRYNSIGALRNHMRGHIQSQSIATSSVPTSSTKQVKEEELGNVVICCLCGESFSNSQDLVNHQLLHNTDQVDNVKTLDNKFEVNDEVNEEKNLICGNCGIFCTSYSHLESHGCNVDTNQSAAENEEEIREPNDNADTSLDKEERQFKCEHCGRSYRHSGSLLNHKKSHKTGLFRCHLCQKNFYNLLALKTHQRSHFDIKRYSCGECGKAYKTQKQLLNHMRRHKKEKLFKSEVQNRTEQQSRSEGEELPLSPNASHDSPSENNKKELQEYESPIKSEDNSDKRSFACDLCGRTYRHAGSLVNHKNSHKTGEYLCSICNNSYSNQLALKNHLRIHFAFKRHSCLKCGKRLRSRKQLLVHVCTNLKRGRRGIRSKCAKTSASGGQTIEPPTKKEALHFYTCNICNRSYQHAGSLLNHKNTHKTGQYNCTFCSKPFSNLLALRNHTRIHTQKKKYACLTCGKAFRVASVLYNHQKIHSRGASRLSCPDCGRGFRGRTGLQRHQCTQGQQSGTAEQHSDRDKCFKCDLCGRSYRHAGSLLNHKKTHSENLHHCSLCLQTFPDSLALHAHSQINRHSCPECGKTFCLLSHMQSHMEVHSKDQKIHQNNVENDILGAPDQNVLTDDPAPLTQQKTDSEDKIHICEHCGRTYRHAGSLLNHKNSHKTGCFLCSVCHKEFTNLMALKNHRRIHTEPKRYQCLECGKAFRVSSQLICHRRIHTRERPFACSVCDKSFSSKSNLRHHQKSHQNSMDSNDFLDLDINAYI
ncbi:zinc finger protein 646 [Boleophthalmus pectinirostris]|uniref:zinc finger protein 646 n=1 Tax=Boleophthalmus pectinirostris TaxID=150288 RepID=UPI0024304FDA|nr:zinc finger protein 646 [Boleophthalmus pectinirostris]